MNPNLPQPQNPQDNNGGPALPPQLQQAPPLPTPQQQPSPNVPGWFAGAPMPNEEPPRREGPHVPVGRILKILTFVIVLAGLIGGIGYGLHSIFSVSDQETDKLTLAQAAFEEEVKKTIYVGDGTDIERTARAKVTYECPTGYEKAKDNKQCISKALTASPLNYKCPKDYDKSATDPAKCIKIEGGTKQTVAAVRSLNCDSGFEKTDDKCVKSEKIDQQKIYECTTSGYEKRGDGPQASCVKESAVTGVPLISCPGGFTLGTSSCTATTAAAKSTVYLGGAQSCPSPTGFVYNSANNLCVRAATGGVGTEIYCDTAGFTKYNDSTCIRGGIATVRAVTGYSTIWTGCTQGTAAGNHQCKVTVAKVRGQCPTGTAPTCYRLVSESSRTQTNYGYVCPSGTTSDGRTAYRPCSMTRATTQRTYDNRTCPAGSSRSESICSYAATAKTVYKCGSVEVPGPNCVQTAAIRYACKAGFNKVGSGSGTTCTKSDNAVQAPSVKIACPDDFKTAGDGCEKTTTKAASSKYVCEDGFKLSGDSCSHIVGGKEVVAEASKSYKCPDGFKSEGSGEDMTCTKVGRDKIELQKAYHCQEGWKQRINKKAVDCVLVKA